MFYAALHSRDHLKPMRRLLCADDVFFDAISQTAERSKVNTQTGGATGMAGISGNIL